MEILDILVIYDPIHFHRQNHLMNLTGGTSRFECIIFHLFGSVTLIMFLLLTNWKGVSLGIVINSLQSNFKHMPVGAVVINVWDLGSFSTVMLNFMCATRLTIRQDADSDK